MNGRLEVVRGTTERSRIDRIAERAFMPVAVGTGVGLIAGEALESIASVDGDRTTLALGGA